MNLVLEAIELPIRIRTERKLTDAELLEFSAANELFRVERDSNGELIVTSLPGTMDGVMETDVAMELRLWSREDGRGRVLGWNAGMTLPDSSVRAADVAWISWERWNALTAEERKGYAHVCPEFVIEVRLGTEELAGLRDKMAIWMVSGAELGWLIDPERRVVEIYRPGEAAEVHEDPKSVQGSGCVRGFELVMARVWG